MQRELARYEAPFGGIPVSLQTAVSFALLSGVLVILDTIVLGIRMGAWKYLMAGFWYLVLVFWVVDRLIKLKRWAWWLTVMLSGVFSIRAAVAALTWLIMRQKGLGPDPQSLAFQLLHCFALAMVFGELVLRSSREAFGIHGRKRATADLASPL